jgi:hypothetical protein
MLCAILRSILTQMKIQENWNQTQIKARNLTKTKIISIKRVEEF